MMNQDLVIALTKASGYFAVVLAAFGSVWAAYASGAAAIGAWKKCYQQDKPAPFLLLAIVGLSLSQTIYALIMMITISSAVVKNPTMWPLQITVGVLGGIILMLSAIYQGRVAANACIAYAETNQGFVNCIMVLGIIDTCAIFSLVFAIMVLA